MAILRTLKKKADAADTRQLWCACQMPATPLGDGHQCPRQKDAENGKREKDPNMTRGVPMIDPKMFGDATPEDVARALLRNKALGTRRGVQSVAGDEVSVEQVASDEAGNGVPHLVKRS